MLPTAEEMREDPEMIHDLNQGMIYAAVVQLREMGEAYGEALPGQMIDTSVLSSPYMPPFVGNDEELDALVEFLATLVGGSEEPFTERGGAE
jgi:hypothetical protein